MNKKELIFKLEEIIKRQESGRSDIENDHVYADDLLLDFINSPKVKKLYNAIDKWYA